MRTTPSRLLLALSLVLAGATATAEAGWKQTSGDAGLRIFTRDKPGTSIKELKAIGNIDAPPHACMNVIWDMGRFQEFMPYTKESRLLSASPNELVSYQYLSLPLISDRDYTLRAREVTPAGATDQPPPYYKKEWVLANEAGPPEREGVVRVKVNNGYWRFDPLEGGRKTQATYYVFTDPGGMLPAFVINQANSQAIPGLFAAVRAQAKSPRYQGARHAPATAASQPTAPPPTTAAAVEP